MDFNEQIIDEFRRNHGKVGGTFGGAPLLLLNAIGARTGKLRVKPVMYLKDHERYVVFASKGDAPTNPDWYHNLKAHPNIQIEVGDEKVDVHALIATPSMRANRPTTRSSPSISARPGGRFQSSPSPEDSPHSKSTG